MEVLMLVQSLGTAVAEAANHLRQWRKKEEVCSNDRKPHANGVSGNSTP